VEYVAISLYLSMFFGALLNYRRVALAEVDIRYTHCGYAIIEALVLAKVILIGEVLRPHPFLPGARGGPPPWRGRFPESPLAAPGDGEGR